MSSEVAVAVVDRDLETVQAEELSPSMSPAKRGLSMKETSLKTRNKQSREIKWSGVNYKVGDKKILTDCWGDVSNFALANDCDVATISPLSLGPYRASVCNHGSKWCRKVFFTERSIRSFIERCWNHCGGEGEVFSQYDHLSIVANMRDVAFIL